MVDGQDEARHNFYTLHAFRGASNMIYNATDSPDLSDVSSMASMFRGASSFNGDLYGWDTSSVTDMSDMFFGASSFNGDISDWDTSSVVRMNGMFVNAYVFNGDISDWDTSSVTDMGSLFHQASSFNRDISGWDTSKVTDMGALFYYASSFNGDISGWDTSSATTMVDMFSGASSFNGDISGWDTSSVTTMANMFSMAYYFNGALSPWDVSSVTDMDYMFYGASSFNQNLGSWYITLNSTHIHDGSYAADIRPQNSYLRGHNPSYSLVDGAGCANNANFTISGNVLTMISAPTQDAYSICVEASGSSLFGTGNARQITLGVDITPQNTNRQPIADAGANRTVSEGAAVQLDGSTSSDPDGDQLSYTWTAPPDMALQNNNTATPSFMAPEVSADTDYTLALTVSDGNATATDTVTITVQDTDPQNPDPMTAALADDFVTTWRVTANDKTVTIPVGGATGTYTIHWGDGTNSTDVTGDQSHTYESAGDHTVRISGDFTRIYLGGDSANAQQLKSIDQWGSMEWSSMESAFRGASNMIYNATDSPDLSGVSSMASMFHGASSFNGNLSGWDTSSVGYMHHMFHDASSFNGDISDWDVSNAITLYGMFMEASSFNGDISDWDVSNAIQISGMFQNASSFNGDLSSWDTSKVAHMGAMFHHASSFNGDISAWDTSSVVDMDHMFAKAVSFNGDISEWDTSRVGDMSYLFNNATSFNGDISEWDTSQVTDMHYMFRHASSFNGDISEWDTSKVTNMYVMFRHASSFNADISDWDVSRVTNMDRMFEGTDSFARNLGPWYITLDHTLIHENGTYAANIAAQNGVLRSHGPSYYLADSDTYADNANFAISGNVLTMISAPTKATYNISIGAESPRLFGTDNTRQFQITAPHLNSPPRADAGPDQAVSEGATIHLNGSASSDPNGDTISYSWTLVPRDRTVTLQDADTQAPSFTAPGIYTNTNYTLALTVSDGIATDTDTVTITVQDTDPLNPDPMAAALADDFVTTWNVAANNTTITIPVGGATGTYTIHWGDGTNSTDVTGDQSHTYESAGDYTVRISGDFTRIYLGNDSANAQQLKSIDQWGSMEWSSMESAFRGASNMIYNATDSPDLSGVSSMAGMFRGASSFNGDLSAWDTSSVTLMHHIFHGASSFNGDISDWDISNVITMYHIFRRRLLLQRRHIRLGRLARNRHERHVLRRLLLQRRHLRLGHLERDHHGQHVYHSLLLQRRPLILGRLERDRHE